jgi:hypothetical protein
MLCTYRAILHLVTPHLLEEVLNLCSKGPRVDEPILEEDVL